MSFLITDQFFRLKRTRIFSNIVNLSSIQLSNMVLMVIMYPIITRIVGIEAFGSVMLATSFAGLAGMMVNYGTNQSGVKEVALNKADPKQLSAVFFNTLGIRTAIFTLSLAFIFVLQWMDIRYYSFILCSVPLILAEVLNPLFFFLGQENLSAYNIANLVSKIVIILLVIFFVKGPADAVWVNFILGTVTIGTYGVLLALACRKYQIELQLPQKQALVKIGKENFYLTGNNVSVHLQQSLMIFVLAKWGSPSLLGAYSLTDKIIWSARLMIISVSNGIYPKAAQLFITGQKTWRRYMQRMKLRITGLFLAGSLILFGFAEIIIQIIAGEPDATAVTLLRVMAFLPAIAALNSLNVLNLLIRNDNKSIFRIAIILLLIAGITAAGLLLIHEIVLLGAYTLIIEICAVLMYEYRIKKQVFNNY